MEAINLSTTYMTLELAHPIVPSASPFTETLDGIRAMEDAGAAAIVMHSLFEEQIAKESEQLDHYLSYFTEAYAEAQTWFPEQESYAVGPDDYLERISHYKQMVDIPIIGSLNGVSTGGWIEYAKLIEEAGADALELNIYYIPTDIRMSGGQVEEMYLEVVRDVSKSISIPLSVKIGSQFSAPANMARRLSDAGAAGLVLFNRFYQPDLDLDELEGVPHLVLSHPFEMRMPLRWVALLYGRVEADLAITSGVRDHMDVLKGLMAGANVMTMASVLLQKGIEHITSLRDSMATWMEEHEYESVEQLRGSMSQQHVRETAAFERANYMKVLQSWRSDPLGQLAHQKGVHGTDSRGGGA